MNTSRLAPRSTAKAAAVSSPFTLSSVFELTASVGTTGTLSRASRAARVPESPLYAGANQTPWTSSFFALELIQTRLRQAILAACIAWTSCAWTSPNSARLTACNVCSSVTRSPSTNSDCRFIVAIIFVIWIPPPCTTTAGPSITLRRAVRSHSWDSAAERRLS